MFALSSIPTATRVSSARPSVSSRSRARAVTTRASNADHHRDVPVVSRRALSLSASTLAVLGAVALVEPRPSDAAYGSASGGGGGEDATEVTWDTEQPLTTQRSFSRANANANSYVFLPSGVVRTAVMRSSDDDVMTYEPPL